MSKCHCRQKVSSVSKCFLKPSALDDSKTISSANIRVSSIVFCNDTPTSLSASFALSPLRKRLKSKGLSLHPCLTPLLQLKLAVICCAAIFTLAVAFAYIDFSMAIICLLIPREWSFSHNNLCCTLSNAFLKSTKHTNRGTLAVCDFSINVFKIKTQSVAQRFFRNPNCSSGMTLLSSAHSPSLVCRIDVKILAMQLFLYNFLGQSFPCLVNWANNAF